MQSNKLSILIVNWNNKNVILECLKSIEKEGYISSVVVVDCASKDRSIRMIKEEYPQVKILRLKEDLGYGGGNNHGILYLLKKQKEFIFILNPDTVIRKGAINKLLDYMEKREDVGIAGPKILADDGTIWSAGGVIDKKRFSGGLIGIGDRTLTHYSDVTEPDFITGTAMMVRAGVFEKAGLFGKDFFMYYEDVDLCLRVKEKGFKVVYVPQAVIIHKESSSYGRDSPAQQYYMARNHLLFIQRNAPFLVRLRETIRLTKTLREHLKKGEFFSVLGILDFFQGRLGRRDYWR